MNGIGPHQFRAGQNLRVRRGSPQRTLRSRLLLMPQADSRRATQEARSPQFSETSLTTGKKKGHAVMTKSIRVAITFVAAVALAATVAVAQSEAQK